MAASHHAVGEHEISYALRTILASETFTRSQQLSRLLKYLCDCVLAHGSDHISEYNIGVQALGRTVDFDPTQDSAVRVEIHRLRRRLREYYESEGSSDKLRIVIPAGQYAPSISRPEEEATENGAPVEAAAASLTHGAENHLGETRELGTQEGHNWYHISNVVLFSALAIVVTGFSAWFLTHVFGSTATGHNDPVKAFAAMPALSTGGEVRIRCGNNSKWTDRLGQIWGSDEYFQGGEATQIPARFYIAGAYDARLFESARTGNFSYRIPLPAHKTYEMRLYFIEPVFGPENDQGGEANRLFKFFLNGREIFDRFDIYSDADGSWSADVRAFKDLTPGPDGYLHLEFQSLNSKALLNAIELIPARPHILNPIRLLPQDNFYTDSAGNLWTPDNYYTGGRISLHSVRIRNTRDQELFRHERFGRFRYAIPVDRGSYSVYLYLSEEYWGPGNQGGGGEGTRVFSVYCNGIALLRSMDVFKESGTNYGIVRGFHHLTPNAQGKLMLSFEPEHDYASIYGIEVIDEAGPDRPSFETAISRPDR